MVQHRRDLDLQPFGYGTGNLPGYSTRAAREATHVTVLLGHAGTQSEWCHAKEAYGAQRRCLRYPCANTYVAYAAPSDSCSMAFVLRFPTSSQASW